MIQTDQLDKKTEHKDQVVLRLLFPNVKTYKANADVLRKIANDAGASGAVRMG